jgi:hypothetical protein
VKFLLLLAAVLVLNSCNTSIGLWRDTQQAYSWTKEKIQGTGSDKGGNQSGAPVY